MKYELVEANGQFGVRRITPMGSVFMFNMNDQSSNAWWSNAEYQVRYCYTPDRKKAEDIYAKLEPVVIASKGCA